MFKKQNINGWSRDDESNYNYYRSKIPTKWPQKSIWDTFSSWLNNTYRKIRFGITGIATKTPNSNHFKNFKRNTIYGLISFFTMYMLWLIIAIYTQLPEITPEGISQSSQTSAVTDKNGRALYSFYEQNRQNILYNEMSPQTINAFVAMEDQSFWTNGGIDIFGVIRAMISTMRSTLGLWGKAWWASTITQQLLKNVLELNKDEDGFYDKIVRKHKERLLVGKLGNVVETDVIKKFPNLSSKELEKKKKEKIMELYLNYIYLGNQAYWIESASHAYFDKSAKELSVVEWAILASMPQAPTKYNPYKFPWKVLWSLVIRDTQGNNISGTIADSVIQKIASIAINDPSDISKGNNFFQKYVSAIVPSSLMVNSVLYEISYEAGRKDAVLNRMYEDNYIDQDQLKRAFIDGLTLKLKPSRVDIKAPHFVFWIRDLLTKGDSRFKDLNITEEMLYKWGIQIKTTLDINMQTIAEKSVKDNMPILYDRWWNNRSLLHIDTTNGDVLAYVWSADYNNVVIQWQNDMIRNPRQPGSSIKPFIYAYALQQLPLSLDTPIYDIPLQIGTLTPNNADGRFEGPLPLRFALAHSRNIPAIKAYRAAGKEEKIKPYLQWLGLKSLENNKSYGYSLSIGAGNVPMLEMAQAYSVLSQAWSSYDINPILEIKDAEGKVVYSKEPKKKESELKGGPSYLIRKILSDTNNMPGWRIKYYAINGFKYAVKSGTSNKVINLNGKEKSLPRDGRLATYTPSRVTMYRAGNADDKPMNANALWLLLNSEVNKSFYGQMLAKGLINNEDMSPVDVNPISISKITGKISTTTTPTEFIVKTLAFNTNIPSDTKAYIPVSLDISCGAKASPLTPSNERIRWYIFTPNSISTLDSNDINKWYNEKLLALSKTGINQEFYDTFLITQEPKEYCEGRKINNSDTITVTTPIASNQKIPLKFTISFSAQSTTTPIQKISIIINDVILATFNYNDFAITDSKIIKVKGIGTGASNLQIVAITEDKKAGMITIPVIIDPAANEPIVAAPIEVPNSGSTVEQTITTWITN